MAINLNQQNPNNQQGQAQPGQQPQGANRPKGTGFTNLQRVLGANKDNKLGQTVGQGVQNIANKTQSQTQGAQETFAKDIGSAVKDIKTGQKITQNLSGIDFSANADDASNRLKEIGGDEYTAAAKNLRAGYQGPQGLQNQNQLQAQSQQLDQTAQGLMTQGGRQAALRRFLDVGPNYTQGKQNLDNMLLGQNPEAIREARRNAAQTAQRTNEALKLAQQQGQSTAAEYNQFAPALSNLQQSATDSLNAALGNRAIAKTTEAKTKAGQLKADLIGGNLSQEQYDYMLNDVLGGSQDTFDLTGEQLGNMVNANTNFNKSNLATRQDIESRDALAKLAGASSGDEILDLDESQAGTAGPLFVKNQEGINAYQQRAKEAQDAISNFKFNPLVGTAENPNVIGAANMYQQYVNPELLKFKAPQSLDYAAMKDVAANYAQSTDPNPEQTQQTLRDRIFSYAGRNQNTYGVNAAMNPYAGNQWGVTEQEAAQNIDKLNQMNYQQQLGSAVDQYNQINKKYGVGNNLSRLLKANKTFGVT